MPELAVAVHYENSARKAALTALRVTFPLWGVVAPISAICFLVPCYFSFIADRTIAASLYTNLLGSFALLLAFVAGLLAVDCLAKDKLLIDKHGVKLPFSLLSRKRRYSWAEIAQIKVSRNDSKSWQEKDLALVTSKKTENIELLHLSPANVEKIILAVEMWGSAAKIDDSVEQLKQEVAGQETKQLSYTEMWEDELNRRFSPTAFVPLEPGRVMRNGTLKVVRHLALGGLSAVYLCQLDDRKLVVLKEAVVSDDTTESAQAKAREMLEREASMLLKLNHANVVRVLDHFTEQGRDYVMLDYVCGQDLRQLVRQNGPQKEGVVLTWALQMVAALKYLHEQDPPVIHRDFTPDNLVLCDDGSVVVIDFGAANEFISTATGTFVGKHAFIAPEQFRGKAVLQSDIYAFGCTLYFLLTGKEPEALATSNPATENINISPDICQLIETCTQLDARDRYQSAAQLMPVIKGLSANLSSLS